MGRELKRVPIDFDYEIGKLWEGFINPNPIHECKECEGLGYSKHYNKLKDRWYGYDMSEDYRPNPYRKGFRFNANAWNNNVTKEDVKALIESNRLWDFTRRPLNDEQKEIVKKKMDNGGNSWLPFNNGYVPTPDEVNEWNHKGLGHDSSNRWIIIKAKLKRGGLPLECDKCNGTGENWISEEAKYNRANWKEYEPPTGDGYQLWSTTTEGHPMSPVFKTLEMLCEHLEFEKVSVFGRNTATKDEWFNMLDDGLVVHREGNTVFI